VKYLKDYFNKKSITICEENMIEMAILAHIQLGQKKKKGG